MTDAAPTRVLVTGAAGLVGRRVVELLDRHGIVTTGLVLPGTAAPGTTYTVYGDASDAAAVTEALAGVQGVIHLAAIPTPTMTTGEVVFRTNTFATFTVLDRAVAAGVRRAVIASSFSVTGLPFAPTPLAPAYLPVDEDIPLQIADAYALSKQVDEATAAMMARRDGLSVVALRLPFIGGTAQRLPVRAAALTERPEDGVRDMWSYLDDRDAALAFWHALTEAPPGYHAIGVAAPDTLCPYPTQSLLDAYLPGVPRRRVFPGRSGLIDTSQAELLLRYRPRYPYPLEDRPWPTTT